MARVQEPFSQGLPGAELSDDSPSLFQYYQFGLGLKTARSEEAVWLLFPALGRCCGEDQGELPKGSLSGQE